jgi:hypothetical protein
MIGTGLLRAQYKSKVPQQVLASSGAAVGSVALVVDVGHARRVDE